MRKIRADERHAFTVMAGLYGAMIWTQGTREVHADYIDLIMDLDRHIRKSHPSPDHVNRYDDLRRILVFRTRRTGYADFVTDLLEGRGLDMSAAVSDSIRRKTADSWSSDDWFIDNFADDHPAVILRRSVDTKSSDYMFDVAMINDFLIRNLEMIREMTIRFSDMDYAKTVGKIVIDIEDDGGALWAPGIIENEREVVLRHEPCCRVNMIQEIRLPEMDGKTGNEIIDAANGAGWRVQDRGAYLEFKRSRKTIIVRDSS